MFKQASSLRNKCAVKLKTNNSKENKLGKNDSMRSKSAIKDDKMAAKLTTNKNGMRKI